MAQASATTSAVGSKAAASDVGTPTADDGATNRAASIRSGRLAIFCLLPAIAMSLGWGLRGTIGGSQIGAMIPGAIVTLCLCHLLGWSRSTGIVAAIGAVGVGLGGQETYGQTIGFLRHSETVRWGLAGLTIKGAMWGLSGGLLVGFGLMHARYRPREIALGLFLMIAGTIVGWLLVDQPKLAYFSNRLDKPRDELWVGLTLGALALFGYLALLRKERISSAFALWGMLAGGAGFGIGGAFIALGFVLPEPYRGWPWWKVMEFTFGFLYGLGLGCVCYRHRRELADEGTVHRGPGLEDQRSADHVELQSMTEAGPVRLLDQAPIWGHAALGLLVAVGALWLNFSWRSLATFLDYSIQFRPTFSAIAPVLILIALFSNNLGWQIALTMTAAGFIRDFLRREVEQGSFPAGDDGWLMVTLATVPVAFAVALAHGRRSIVTAILGLSWLATLFGLVKVGIPAEGKSVHIFVPAVFVIEAVLTTALVHFARPEKDVAELSVEE